MQRLVHRPLLQRPLFPRVAAHHAHHDEQCQQPSEPPIVGSPDTALLPVPTRPVFGHRYDGRDLGRLHAIHQTSAEQSAP